MRRLRTRRIGAALLLTGMCTIAGGFMLETSATAVPPGPTRTEVTICHRTNSVTNPYEVITVSFNAADGSLGNGANDHTGHNGLPFDFNADPDVAYPPPRNGDQWGDIIPPYGAFPGKNWPAGEAIWTADCADPTTTATTAPPTTGGPTTAPPTTAPPTTAPPTTAPPTTAPPTTAPPTTAPPTTAPPTTAPPTTAPPTTAPPTTAPPTTGPPNTNPPGTNPPNTTPSTSPPSTAPGSTAPPSSAPPTTTPEEIPSVSVLPSSFEQTPHCSIQAAPLEAKAEGDTQVGNCESIRGAEVLPAQTTRPSNRALPRTGTDPGALLLLGGIMLLSGLLLVRYSTGPDA